MSWKPRRLSRRRDLGERHPTSGSTLGLRLPGADRDAFAATYGIALYQAHGAVMTEYAAVPPTCWPAQPNSPRGSPRATITHRASSPNPPPGTGDPVGSLCGAADGGSHLAVYEGCVAIELIGNVAAWREIPSKAVTEEADP